MATIDERIVSMKFDNQNFESGVSTTMSSLEKLKSALKFDKISNPDMDLSKIASGIESLSDRFSTMGIIGMTAIQNITNSAINMGKQLASAVSIDSIRQGFSEYETQMDSVQTIMANTGKSVDEVNASLDVMNNYADKTIYNFQEMASNLGRFTAAGTDLDTSQQAIMGISNLAAVSGSNSNKASVAMYQLSQAIAAGSLKLQDWNSVVNAGMGGKVFQDALQRTAQHMLDNNVQVKDANGNMISYAESIGGVTSSIKDIIATNGSFRESLKTGWITTDVLTETLRQFQMNVETTEDYEKAVKELVESGYTQEEAKQIADMAKTAMDAATKVKTFSQLIDTTKEALGSGWTRTWQLVIGDFEEAKELWTGVSEAINEIINPIADARNAMFTFWHDNGGRTAIIEAITNAWEGLKQVMGAISEAFRSVFPPMTGQKLVEISEKIRDLTSRFKLSEPQVNQLKRIFTGLFNVLKIGQRVLEAIIGKVKPIVGVLKPVASAIIHVVDIVTDFITGVANADNMIEYIAANSFPALGAAFAGIQKIFNIDPNSGLGKGLETLGNAAESVKTKFLSIKSAFATGGIFGALEETINQISQTIKSGIFEGLNIDQNSVIGKALNWIIDTFSNFGYMVTNVAKNILHGDFKEAFNSIIYWISETIPGFDNLVDTVKSVKDWVVDAFGTMIKKLTPLGTAFKSAGEAVSNFFSRFGKSDTKSSETSGFIGQISMFEKITSVLRKFVSFLGSIGGKLVEWGGKIGAAIPKLFSYLGSEDFRGILTNLNVLLGGGVLASISKFFNSGASFLGGNNNPLQGFLDIVNNVKSGAKNLADSIKSIGDSVNDAFGALSDKINGKEKDLGATLLKIAAAIGILAGSVFILSKTDPEGVSHGVVAVAAAAGVLIGAFKLLQMISDDPSFDSTKMKALTTQMIKLAIGIGILSLSFSSLAKLEWEDIGQGLTGVAGMIAILVGAVYALGKVSTTGSLKQISAGLIVFAIGIRVLASSVKALGNMDFLNMVQGLLGIVGLLEMINLFIQEANMSGLTLKGAASILIVTEAIKVLGKTAISMASMSWEEFTRGLLGTLTMLAAINLFTQQANLSGLSMKAAASILITMEAVKVLSKTVLAFASLSWEDFIKGLLGVLTILEALNIFTQEASLSGMSVSTTVGILALTLAINSLAGVVMDMGGMSWEQLAKGLIGLAGAVAAITIPLVLLGAQSGAVLAAAAAMVVMSVSLRILVPVIKALSGLSIGDLLKSLLGLAGAFTVLGVAGMAFGTLAPIMLLGSVAIAALGAATVITGLGLLSVATGLGALGIALATNAAGIVTGISVITVGIVSLVPQIATAIAQGIIIFAKTIIDGITTIIESVVTMVQAVLAAVRSLLPDIIETAYVIIMTLLKTIRDKIPEIVKVAAEIIVAFCLTLQKYLPMIAEAAVKMIITLVNSIADGIRKYAPQILAAVRNILSSVIELVITAIQDILRMIPIVGDSLASGLDGAKSAVQKTIAPESMSKIGSDAMGTNGLAGGISSQNSAVSNASLGIGDAITSKLGNALSGGFDLGSDYGSDLSGGLLSTNGLLGNSATGLGNAITDNLDLDLSQYGKMYGNDIANGIDLSQFDVSGSTQDLTTNILNSFSDADADFENAGGLNVGSYLNAFTSNASLNDAKESAGELADEGVDGVESREDEFKDVGKDAARGFGDGLSSTSVKQYVENKAKTLANSALNSMRQTLDSHSPSKETQKIGAFAGEGFALGLVSMISTAKKAAGNLSETTLDGMRNALTSVAEMASGSISTDPVIRPVLDLTNVQNGVVSMNSMFGSPLIGLRASLAGTGDTMQGLYGAANAMGATPSGGNSDLLGEMTALREDVKNLGQAMSQMKMFMDGKEVGGIVSGEVDRRLGLRYLRNRREGRA